MIFDGRKFQNERSQILKEKIRQLRLKGQVLSLASFYFADDKASQVYTRLKEKKAVELGIRFLKYGIKIMSKGGLERIIELIKLEASNVDGVLVQKPSKILTTPDRYRDEVFYTLAKAVPVGKDVDVISPVSIGRLIMINNPLEFLWPATVRAIMWILAVAMGVYNKGEDNPFKLVYEKEVLRNRKVVVVGNRGMVGSMISLAVAGLGARVIGGDKGVEVKDLVQEGEILISCTGVPELIKSGWLNEKQLIIDVGFGEKEGGVMGDFEAASYEKVRFAAPVPGGVGPITVISLMENLFDLSV